MEYVAEQISTARLPAVATTGTKPKRRGRKKADYETIQREDKLATAWVQARDSSTYKIDFAKEQRMALKDFDNLLDRVAKRKRK